MKYTKNLALALALSLTLISTTQAQSEEEDPLAAFAELEAALEELEELETTEEETSESSESSSETAAETSTEESTQTAEEPEGKMVSNRLLPKEVPEGKEDHLLYNIPGAIEYRGMTFLKIDSPRFFNRFQKCDTTEADKTYNVLARLKISQGAPLECRESMKYQFMPYKTFRATR